MNFKPEIEVIGKCPFCKADIAFKGLLMKAYRDPRYKDPCYTSDLRSDQKEVPPEKAFYSYETNCPGCGEEIEGVLSEIK